MAKGDKVVVTSRTGDKVQVTTVEARTRGASVVVAEPTAPARGTVAPTHEFFTVTELNMKDAVVRTIRFAAEAVLIIEEQN